MIWLRRVLPNRACEARSSGAAVRLDLDDPSLAPARVVLADEARTEELTGDRGRRAGQAPAVEDGHTLRGYIASILSGMRNPNRMKNAGIRVDRKKSTICDESRNSQKSCRNCSSLPVGGTFSR